MLYFAYGANTNMAGMQRRCPDAFAIGAAILDGHALKFKGVADVVPAKGGQVFGGLWDISAGDEAALDLFEGFPTLYTKREVVVHHGRRKVRAMIYVMTSREFLTTPSDYYRDVLIDGYTDFDLPLMQIHHAIVEAKRAQGVRFRKELPAKQRRLRLA